MESNPKTELPSSSPNVVPKTKVIVIDGLISAGKSSLTTAIGDCGFTVVPECLQRYRSFEGHDPLAELYDNPRDNVVAAQLHFIRTINDQLTDYAINIRQKLLVTDRSLFSPIVFIETHDFRGTISKFTRDYLISETRRCAEGTLRDCSLEYAGIFFLDVPVDECLKRIRIRGRDCEQSIEKSYLANLRDKYTVHLDWWRGYLGSPDLVRVVQSGDINSILNQFRDFVSQIC